MDVDFGELQLVNFTSPEVEMEDSGLVYDVRSEYDLLSLVSTPGDTLTVSCPHGKVQEDVYNYLKTLF